MTNPSINRPFKGPPPFTTGQRVILTRARHEKYRGLHGTVKKFIRARGGEVAVLLDAPPEPRHDTYYANVENVDPEAAP